jgi:hypothetical protein
VLLYRKVRLLVNHLACYFLFFIYNRGFERFFHFVNYNRDFGDLNIPFLHWFNPITFQKNTCFIAEKGHYVFIFFHKKLFGNKGPEEEEEESIIAEIFLACLHYLV